MQSNTAVLAVVVVNLKKYAALLLLYMSDKKVNAVVYY